MMRLLLPLLICCGLPLCANASMEHLLQQAHEAYAQADYKQALALYDSVNATHTSAGLLYNIGNCHSKLGYMPHAILYYERALRLAPGTEDIQANLDLERANMVDRVNLMPAFTLGTAWDRLQGGKDVDHWARRSLWACALMAAAAGAALLLRQRLAKRMLAGLAAVALAFTVVAATLAAYRVQEAESRSEAIIMAPTVEILGEPRKGSTRLFILHQGTKLSLLGEQGEWQEVRLASGSVGWLPKSAIEVI